MEEPFLFVRILKTKIENKVFFAIILSEKMWCLRNITSNKLITILSNKVKMLVKYITNNNPNHLNSRSSLTV